VFGICALAMILFASLLVLISYFVEDVPLSAMQNQAGMLITGALLFLGMVALFGLPVHHRLKNAAYDILISDYNGRYNPQNFEEISRKLRTLDTVTLNHVLYELVLERHIVGEGTLAPITDEEAEVFLG
jgi:hypothetical protein